MHSPLFLLLLAVTAHSKGIGTNEDDNIATPKENGQFNKENVDFVGTRLSVFGELETRLSYKGIQAMEVVIPSEGEQGLFYRQITDGRKLVQMIYKGLQNLVDCDISADEGDMARFYGRFLGADEVFDGQRGAGLTRNIPGGNVTMRIITGDLDGQLRALSNFKQHRRECHAFVKQLKKLKKEASREGRLGLFDNNDVKEPSSSHRSKRSMFIYPGTKWCGKGSVSTNFDDLGENIATDKCCREHDFCPYTIEGFTTSFGVFNYRFHTLSHCNCDENFRACLRSAGNDVANIVGELYFNVVGTKCFTLKKEKECVERSWWGKCSKYESTHKAYVQEPLIF